jgi:DNA gyrase subunit A
MADDDELLLINSDGVIIRIGVNEIKPQGRQTLGVKIMRVSEGSQIIAIAKVVKEAEVEE